MAICCSALALLLVGGALAAPALLHPPAPTPICYLAPSAERAASPTEQAEARQVIDAYFTLQYESWLLQQALDLSPVIDNASDEGTALLEREQGRLKSNIQHWRETDTTIAAYHYHPVYYSIRASADKLVVCMRPCADLSSPWEPGHFDPCYGDRHELILVRRPGGWRILADGYSDSP